MRTRGHCLIIINALPRNIDLNQHTESSQNRMHTISCKCGLVLFSLVPFYEIEGICIVAMSVDGHDRYLDSVGSSYDCDIKKIVCE